MKNMLKGFTIIGLNGGVMQVDSSTILVGGLVLKQPMIDNFVNSVKRDRKKFENINIYYEIMNQQNCKDMGFPYDLKTLNCCDGDELWNQQRDIREAQGYVYLEPEDVNIGGIKCKRIVISVPEKRGQDFADHFGLMSGYIQAGHEIVAYMVSYGKNYRK